MKYKVAVIETYKEVVEVEADNEDEALSTIWQRYQDGEDLNGDIVLENVNIELC